MMSRGLFLGKFMPPHNGHLFVCDVARRHVDQLTVLLCSTDAEVIDGHLRATWMRECLKPYGSLLVHMHRDIPQEPNEHPDFWKIWKEAIFGLHPEPVDYVFGSEDYIYNLAATLNAKPFVVDPDRDVVPISATAIREDPFESWEYIPQPVRSHFQKRITLLGPESSGKSTLSKRLADRFGTKSIPEYGRTYDAAFKQGTGWNAADFNLISRSHASMAAAIANNSGPIVFEDTDLLQTIVWSEFLLGEAPQPLVDRLDTKESPAVYLLLSPEVDWIDDGTRYHSTFEQRNWFHARLKFWLDHFGATWEGVCGASWDRREKNALDSVCLALGLSKTENCH